MTLNRLSPALKKKFLDMQQLYYLAERSKNNKGLYYWQGLYYWDRQRYVSLVCRTDNFTVDMYNILKPKDLTIIYMRYVLKLSIATIMERTGYCKRSVLYHLQQSIQKLEEYENDGKRQIFYSVI